MTQHALQLIAIVLVGWSMAGCQKEVPQTHSPEVAYWQPQVPSHFPDAHYQNSANSTTKAGFELGRSLFYDPILSGDSTVSCGSCHDIAHGFADHGTRFSTGVGGRIGKRNAPAVVNMRWYPAFMWDGGINHLEVMPVGPLTNPLEMNEAMANVVNKLRQHPTYPTQFAQAFGSHEVNDQKLLLALTQFMVSIVSVNSKYDRVMQGSDSFTDNERQGYQLFQTNCASCHREPLFTNFTYQRNGIATDESDLGRYLITLSTQDSFKFKVPTLRNLSFTYPYMHNGSFPNLSSILEHYRSLSLNPQRPDGFASMQPLSSEDVAHLLSFLRTLNDPTLLGQFHYANPND